MTLREALDRADSLHPGSVPEAERIAWLDSIDRTVCAEITGGEFGGYTVDSPADTELLVPPPYIRSHRPARRELNYLGGDRI